LSGGPSKQQRQGGSHPPRCRWGSTPLREELRQFARRLPDSSDSRAGQDGTSPAQLLEINFRENLPGANFGRYEDVIYLVDHVAVSAEETKLLFVDPATGGKLPEDV